MVLDDDNDFFLYGRRRVYKKFKVVGLIPSAHFQKCKFIVEKLHVSYPKVFARPEIRAMLNLDWDEYLTKMKRRHGKPYYLLQNPVAVYIDGNLLGDDKDLQSYIAKDYSFEPNIDFRDVCQKALIDYFTDILEKKKRKLVYLTIAVDEHVVGSILFMLYNDLVPVTCDNFFNRCQQKTNGYKGVKVHRIAKYSWIQCGGFDLHHVNVPCENYAVPHDRRGILSMCNKRIHEDNNTQFYITLEPASWMDYKYVAFGQLLQGAEILNQIENISTYYQSPIRKIEIANCGEFSLCPQPDEEYSQTLNPPFESLFNPEVKSEDIDSVLSWTGYKAGKYCLKTDLKSYLPFLRYSQMFDVYFKGIDTEAEELPHMQIEEQSEAEEKYEEGIRERVGVSLTVDQAKLKASPSNAFYLKHVIM